MSNDEKWRYRSVVRGERAGSGTMVAAAQQEETRSQLHFRWHDPIQRRNVICHTQ